MSEWPHNWKKKSLVDFHLTWFWVWKSLPQSIFLGEGNVSYSWQASKPVLLALDDFSEYLWQRKNIFLGTSGRCWLQNSNSVNPSWLFKCLSDAIESGGFAMGFWTACFLRRGTDIESEAGVERAEPWSTEDRIFLRTLSKSLSCLF